MTVTRSYLRALLQEEGFSYREARSIVSAILEALTEALKKDGEIDLPFGTMTLRQPAPKRAYQLGRIVRTYTKPKVHFKRKR